MASSNFRFPPPPPPPPPASSSSEQAQSFSSGNLRGAARGRGRGGGRGFKQSRGGNQSYGGPGHSANSRQSNATRGGRSLGTVGYVSIPFPKSETPAEQTLTVQNSSKAHEAASPFPNLRRQVSGDIQEKGSNHAATPQHEPPRHVAPPAVPSFGASFLPKQDAEPPRKRKRTYNQLGLTPKTEEHESSEDDANEEQKLAESLESSKGQIKIFHRGKLTTLKSPEDVAAWIEERKKRFPTKARIAEAEAERAKQKEEEKEKHEKLAKQRQAKKAVTTQRERKKAANRDARGSSQSKREVKLQKQLERVQRELKALKSKGGGSKDSASAPGVDSNSDSELTSEPSSDSEETSSSGESDELDSESDSDEAPAEQSSKVAPKTKPAPRPKSKIPCRHFTSKGSCRNRKHCRFAHEQPKSKASRVSLYQRLCAQQEAEDAEGEQGQAESAGTTQMEL